MLLVDHDQAGIGDGREDGRARPDADPGLARAQAAPLVVARAGRHPGMKQRDGVAEAPPEAIHRLGRQGDLRDEDDRAPPPRQRLPGRLQVDLRLARAGHAVEQDRRRRPSRPRPGAPRPPAAARRRWSAVSSTPSRTAPTPGESCRRRRSTSRVATRPAGLEPPAASPGRIRRSPPAGGRAGARRPARAAPPAAATRAARPRRPPRAPSAVASTSSSTSGRTRRASAPVPTPGGRTRPRPRRASSSTPPRPSARARPARAGPRPPAPRSARRGGPSRQLAALGEADDDADHPPAPERDHQHRADPDVLHRLGQAVVEGPGDAPGGEQRLHLGDRPSEPGYVRTRTGVPPRPPIGSPAWTCSPARRSSTRVIPPGGRSSAST